MRVISQDGTIDVPYDYFSLSMSGGKYKDVEVAYIYCQNSSSPIGTKLAEYSTEAKAIKAMEMLREQYKALEVLKVLANGTAEHMEKSFKLDEFAGYNRAYRDMNVFQFPQDDEIEV
mgnify:CR=1 FL=1|jgi:hypothetical protein